LQIRPLKALLIADDKPGHYHQAEGVLAAMARVRPVEARRVVVRRRVWIPTRTLHQLLNGGVAPKLILRLGYGIGSHDLSAADVIVSAGGETLAANAAIAKLLAVPNIFCGRLRRLAPEHVRLVIVSLERFAVLPNHLLVLPPSPFELAPPSALEPLGPDNPPRFAGALVGGDSGSVRYSGGDWEKLIRFLRQSHQCHGLRWLVTTSRRSSRQIADALAAMAAESNSPIERFIDYRTAGPGTLAQVLAAAQAILVTADSTTMITEAVGARLPVVAVACDGCAMEEREAEYRELLARKGWYRSLSFSELTPDAFLNALAQVTPRKTSALDELATALAQRLPELFPGK